MTRKLKVGVLRETKTPPDRRVAISPNIASEILKKFTNIELAIQPSDIRCFDSVEYADKNLYLTEDINNCDVLFGVKEIKKEYLVADKTYFFFSHVAKKQPYNREMLQEIIRKKITLIDYEYLTTPENIRVVAFGRWAGIVGAYKAFRAKGLRNDSFNLKPAYQCFDMQHMFEELKKVKLRPIKILLTGGGRVANGALETISVLNIKKVSPKEFLENTFDEPVICQLEPWDYVRHKHGNDFDLKHFFANPDQYESTFKPFTKVADMFIACHFWDPRSPVFFTREDMCEPDWKISVIADISCDLNGPIPSTIRSSTITEPFYGYNPYTGEETLPFSDKKHITVMAVDNLPGELPRDASDDFGKSLLDHVFPRLIGEDTDQMLERATIVKNGKLTPRFAYLQDYVDGK